MILPQQENETKKGKSLLFLLLLFNANLRVFKQSWRQRLRSKRLALSRGVRSDLTVSYMSSPYYYTIKNDWLQGALLIVIVAGQKRKRKFHLEPHTQIK